MTILVSCVQHKKLEKVLAEVCLMHSTFEFNKGDMMIRDVKADHDKRHRFFLSQRSQRLMREEVWFSHVKD